VTYTQAAGAIALVAYGWWATARPPFSASATIAVLVPGALAIAWGFGRRRESPQRPLRPGVSTWALLVVLLGVWEMAAFVQQPRSAHPTLSSITNAALDPHAVRTLAFVAWLCFAATLARQ
jgi:hypothetical protein